MFYDLDSSLEISSDLFTAEAPLEDQIDVYVRQKNLRNVPKLDKNDAFLEYKVDKPETIFNVAEVKMSDLPYID